MFSTLKYYCAVDTQFPTSRIVILDGQVVPYLRNPNAFATIEQRGDMFVKNEYTPQSGVPILVGQYADIDFYDAINQLNFGHTVEAVNAFHQAETTFWDGTGFKDESWNHHQDWIFLQNRRNRFCLWRGVHLSHTLLTSPSANQKQVALRN